MPPASQTVLITGASTGFGRDTAIELARKGHTVYASMRGVSGKNAQHASHLTDLAASEKLRLSVVEIDVTDKAQINAAVEQITSEVGRIDVLINNAGFAGLGMAEGYTTDQARAMFETNYFGPVELTRAVLPHMRAQKSGKLIHVTSGIGRFAMPGMAHYAATKWALEAFSESIRYELAGIGIESSTVEPGAFKTEIFGKLQQPAEPERLGDYGELAGIADGFEGGLQQFFESEAYRGPEIVTEAIVDIVEAEPGSAPTRVAVGADVQAVAELNEQSAVKQRELLAAFGMEAFQPLA